jgi:hypothetical protein
MAAITATVEASVASCIMTRVESSTGVMVPGAMTFMPAVSGRH